MPKIFLTLMRQEIQTPSRRNDMVGTTAVHRASALPAGSRNILLVEDELIVLDLLKEVFDTAGFAVHTTTSAVEALNIFQKGNIDAVIMDIGLPDADCLDMIRTMTSRNPRLVSVIMTSYVNQSLVDKFQLVDHVSEIYVKPFNPYDMVDRVRSLLISYAHA